MADPQDTGSVPPRQPGTICPVCGDSHEGAYAHMRDAHPKAKDAHVSTFLLCMSCACVVANLYELRHGGMTLTWETEAPQGGYKKGEIPEGLRWQVFRRDGYACVECDSRDRLTADHVIAESKGGPTTLDNLRTLCRSCNSRKGAK